MGTSGSPTEGAPWRSWMYARNRLSGAYVGTGAASPLNDRGGAPNTSDRPSGPPLRATQEPPGCSRCCVRSPRTPPRGRARASPCRASPDSAGTGVPLHRPASVCAPTRRRQGTPRARPLGLTGVHRRRRRGRAGRSRAKATPRDARRVPTARTCAGSSGSKRGAGGEVPRRLCVGRRRTHSVWRHRDSLAPA